MKCRSINCNNKATIYGWCNNCLDKLGDFIEKNPIGCHRTIEKLSNND